MLLLAGLVCLMPAAVWSCRSQDAAGAGDSALARAAWLGSAEGWGVLGFPRSGGALAYREGEDLESPTWSPPELGKVERGWPGVGAIWLQFDDGRVGRYDYSSGYLNSFRGFGSSEEAVVLEGGAGLVLAPDRQTLQSVSQNGGWRFELGGRLQRLESAGSGRLLAAVETAGGLELLVLAPPDSAMLGRRTVNGLSDLAVMPWGDRLFYLMEGEEQPALHELGLPQLDERRSMELSEAARLVAATPSGHRLYVVAGRNLYVIDNLSGKRLRRVKLPSPASALRFGINGAVLLARVEKTDSVMIVQVGIDKYLGMVPAKWEKSLPAVLPGGRLVTQEETELVLYSIPGLEEIARAAVAEPRVWFTVSWEPPRPRTELAQRLVRAPQVADRQEEGQEDRRRTSSAGSEPASASPPPASPGYYAVVIAARDRKGVDDLVEWLLSVDFPATVDRHVDVMGVVWFRAMAGPYPGREAAEEAARTLGARYGYKPWILSVENPES